MRIALIGDIHTFSLKLEPRRLISRRILGQSNLWLNRRFRFNHLLLEPLLDEVRRIKPDLVLLSGDVTTTSLEDEFLDIERYLRPLAKQFPTILVPGNHDRYTFRAARARRMEQLLTGLIPEEFPYFKALTSRWKLLALDSASPQIVLSRGALGLTQLAGTRRFLRKLSPEEGLVVLCHYPIATPSGIPNSWAHALAEEKPLRRMLRQCAARVVFLHGHIHRPWYWAPADPGAADSPDMATKVATPGDVATPQGVATPGDVATPLLSESSSEGAGIRSPALARLCADDRKPAPFADINAGAPCLTSNAYPLGQGFWQINLPDDPVDTLGLIHHAPMPRDRANAPFPRRRRRQAVLIEPEWKARQVL